jgi:TolA-binding protein
MAFSAKPELLIQTATASDNSRMRGPFPFMPLLFCSLALAANTVSAQAPVSKEEPLHAPRVMDFEPREDTSPDVAECLRSLKQLKAQRESLAAEYNSAAQFSQPSNLEDGPEITKLRKRMGELLTKLNGQPDSRQGDKALAIPVTPPSGMHSAIQPADGGKSTGIEKNSQKPSDANPPEPNRAAEPLALAQALFRSGNYEHALKAFRLVNTNGMPAEERVPVQYLIATCLRKLGKTTEAMALYRDVANARGDDQVAGCAQWQLNLLQWKAEFDSQLKALRDRCKDLETVP